MPYHNEGRMSSQCPKCKEFELDLIPETGMLKCNHCGYTEKI